MSPLRIISWVVTFLFFFIFLLRWAHLFTIDTPNGKLGFAIPYVLGTLTACAIIPGILWIIVYFKEN